MPASIAARIRPPSGSKGDLRSHHERAPLHDYGVTRFVGPYSYRAETET